MNGSMGDCQAAALTEIRKYRVYVHEFNIKVRIIGESLKYWNYPRGIREFVVFLIHS
jgi:hypothetical protein